MKSKGFTLIELLVVIAIIGILASVVLTQVNSARNRTLDTAIKADLKGIVTTAASYSNSNLNDTYGATAIAGLDCAVAGATTQPTGTIFENVGIQNALAHAKKSSGAAALYCNMDASGTGYAIVSPMKSGGFWCVDGTGQGKSTWGTGSTAYANAAGTAATDALDGTADITCN